MDEYKWFKDDFETDRENTSEAHKGNDEKPVDETDFDIEIEEPTSSSDSSDSQSREDTYDYNTSGAGYAEYRNAEQDSFYHTNIKAKKTTKRVPAYVLVASVILTAAVAITGSIYAPKAYTFVKDKVVAFADKTDDTPSKDSKDSKESKGSKVVAQAMVDSDGNKLLTTPEIVDKVGPAVVGIATKTTTYNNYYGFGPSEQQGSGSGVIISSDGYVVTNNHVIENANEVTVILNTNETYPAKVIGADARTDIAVLKIDASELPFAAMGSSSDLRVGDTAIAIGNPLGQEFAGTTTQGIISGLNRSVTIDNKQLNLIQTDAAINPGNSGGALVNAFGQLIGINTAKISSSSLEGLGFAIPIDEAKPVIEDLINNGYVTGRPVIGIGGRAVTEKDAEAYGLKVGVYVASMTPNSPAYMAGVKIGDIIYECDGQKVTSVEEINDVKNKKQPGDEMKLKVYRQDRELEITLILGEDIPSIE